MDSIEHHVARLILDLVGRWGFTAGEELLGNLEGEIAGMILQAIPAPPRDLAPEMVTGALRALLGQLDRLLPCLREGGEDEARRILRGIQGEVLTVLTHQQLTGDFGPGQPFDAPTLPPATASVSVDVGSMLEQVLAGLRHPALGDLLGLVLGKMVEAQRLVAEAEPQEDEAQDSVFPCWAVVQVMGHREVAGHVQYEPGSRNRMYRVTEPDGKVRLLGIPSVFSLDVVPEEAARAAAEQIPDFRKMEYRAAGFQGPPGLTWPRGEDDDREPPEDDGDDEGEIPFDPQG